MTPGIFSYIGGTYDNLLNAFVIQTSTKVSSYIAPIVATGITIWVILYGYAVMRQQVSEPITDFAWRAFTKSAILAFALGTGIYQSEIAGTATALQNDLSVMVAPNSASKVTGENSSPIYQLLDDFDDKGASLGMKLLENAAEAMPFGGWLDLIAGLLVFLASGILLALAGGFVVLSKFGLSLILGFGPLFISTLVFPPIQKLFEAWSAQVMNYIFLAVLLSAIIGMSVAAADRYLVAFAGNTDSTHRVADAVAFMLLIVVEVITIYFVPNLAASLAGGATVSGPGATQMLMRMLTNPSDKKDEKKKGPSNGGSVENNGSGQGGNGNNNRQGGGGAIPAYRRAALERLPRK